MWQQILDYFQNQPEAYMQAFGEHIQISLVALVTACVIGIPAGWLCVKHQKHEKVILSVFQILRIIPSLAILILLIPLMGTGELPAVTALVLLAIPPILMNTVAGFREVPDFMLETAAAMGMRPIQVFWKVHVPLAFPLILTGIKTAAIEIIASATLAAYIGGGGLGTIIFTGLGLNRTDLLLIGGVSVAVLSIVTSILLEIADHLLFRYQTERNH